MRNNIKKVFILTLIFLTLACSSSFAAEAKDANAFKSAFNSANSGDTIKLTGDLKINTNFTLKKNMELTIDLNGHIIDRDQDGDQDDDGNIFTLLEGAKLHIIDSNPNAGHSGMPSGGVLYNGGGDDIGGCIHMEDETYLSMDGGCIYKCTTNDHGGAIRVDGDDVVIVLNNVYFLENCTEDSSDNCHGGAIYTSDNCKLTATNCIFEKNSSEDCGGAVYLEDDSFAIFTNCNFIGNKSKDEAGAVFQDTDSTAYFEYCNFLNNESESDAGAIYIDADEVTKISDCTFTGNYAEENGAAIYINDEACYIVDSTITGNKADEYGGIYVDAYHSVDVMGKVVIKDNKDGKGKECNVYLTSHNYVFGAIPIVAAIYDGGLYEGSYIGLSYDGNAKEAVINESISEYQKQFFHADSEKHPIKWGEDASQEVTELIISSAISEGYIWIIITCSLIIILAGVITTIHFKKKKGGQTK